MADETGVAIDGVSIVVKGHFNAAILSPVWLLSQELISASDFEAAEVDLVTRDLAVFRVAWLMCQVTQDALQLSTSEPDEFERVRDVAVGILRALRHTPIAALGINRDVHLRVGDLARWHEIGDRLSPKEVWTGVLDLPGTRNVTIWAQRPDAYSGRVQVQVEPSLRVPQGVYVVHNDHYLMKKSEHRAASREDAWDLSEQPVEPSSAHIPMAQEILVDSWKDSMLRADRVISRVRSLGPVSRDH